MLSEWIGGLLFYLRDKVPNQNTFYVCNIKLND